ncbi:MAG: precorrin-6y C5,15-methyltransferase (decarboxylating) subunit CbiE [Planctomycetota bacterium]
MATQEKVHVVGVGENGLDGLTAAARELVERAELLVGENHTLDLVPETGAERLVVGTSLDEAVERIEAAPKRRIVVLASGDPLFYGVARYLCDRLGKQRFEVLPHVSSMQLAFARVKESWEDALLTNLATHSLQSVLGQVRTAEKVGLFTSEACPPSTVARTLLEARIDYFTGYVCENLSSPDERVTQGELSELAEQEFSPLNVMILVRKPHVPDRPAELIGQRLFGNPDDAFHQARPKRELVTPMEIRAIALAEMDLGPASVVWDIGAGCGSVSIEAAQISREGKVYAVEQDLEDHQLIIDNTRRFAVANLIPVLGRAPEAVKDLPQPDAVFVDGSGRDICNLVEAVYRRLRTGGRLVAVMASIDNVAETEQLLRRYCPDVKVRMVNLARGNYQLERVRFESLNPTFLVAVVKPG